jgi:hypothetical protein
MGKEALVYIIAALLMIFRADWWWWGKATPIVLFNWLSVAEIYQIGIFFAGWALLVYAAFYVWNVED